MSGALAQTASSADYYPKRQDSHVELVRPETSFLEFFKQSLLYTSAYCADPKCCSFFDDDVIVEGHAASVQKTSPSALNYPLLLFADLQDLPSRTALRSLLQACQTEVVPALPYLSTVSAVVADHEHVPFHLRLCKALAGAATSRDPEIRKLTARLWQACTSLVTGTVEVDNSLGRVTDWLSAATLITTVGVMQSNLIWWRQTNCVNGYLQATLFRQDYPLKSPAAASTQAVGIEISSLRCFYFIVDTLRSIHLHAPSTVDPTWSAKMGKNAQYDLRELCDGLILAGHSLPSDLAVNDYLLVLFDMVSTINTLLSSLGPLTSASWKIRQKASTLYNQEATRSRSPPTADLVTHPVSDLNVGAINPYVPLTADREFKQLSDNLSQALNTWASAFNSGDTSHDAAAQAERRTLLPLLHFAKLLLAAGPCVYTLPSLVGYTSESYSSLPPRISRPCAPHVIGIHFDDHTIRCSAGILESIEAQRNGSGKNSTFEQRRLSPMWYPLALFYGALVIWARTEFDAELDHSNRALLSPRRLLQNFYAELKIIGEDWECARQMSDVVAQLITWSGRPSDFSRS